MLRQEYKRNEEWLSKTRFPRHGGQVEMALTRACPHCKSIEFRSVGVRNAIESAIYWLFQPYRCELCGHHFFLIRWPALASR